MSRLNTQKCRTVCFGTSYNFDESEEANLNINEPEDKGNNWKSLFKNKLFLYKEDSKKQYNLFENKYMNIPGEVRYSVRMNCFYIVFNLETLKISTINIYILLEFMNCRVQKMKEKHQNWRLSYKTFSCERIHTMTKNRFLVYRVMLKDNTETNISVWDQFLIVIDVQNDISSEGILTDFSILDIHCSICRFSEVLSVPVYKKMMLYRKEIPIFSQNLEEVINYVKNKLQIQ